MCAAHVQLVRREAVEPLHVGQTLVHLSVHALSIGCRPAIALQVVVSGQVQGVSLWRKQEAVLKATAVQSPLLVMLSILPFLLVFHKSCCPWGVSRGRGSVGRGVSADPGAPGPGVSGPDNDRTIFLTSLCGPGIFRTRQRPHYVWSLCGPGHCLVLVVVWSWSLSGPGRCLVLVGSDPGQGLVLVRIWSCYTGPKGYEVGLGFAASRPRLTSRACAAGPGCLVRGHWRVKLDDPWFKMKLPGVSWVGPGLWVLDPLLYVPRGSGSV